jgi:hypothetical protein
VKRKDRRSREARQDHDRFAPGDRQAQRLSRLQRDAVNDNARIVERGDSTVAQIAGALRRATGKDDHVAGGKPFVDKARQNGFVVGSNAERLRAAAGFLDGSREDRGIRVIDRARADRLTRCDDLVAGRDDGYQRPPPDFDSSATDRR